MIERGGKRAIALEYDGASAPRISAIGTDAIAEQIIAIAREHGVPMMENRELAALLSQMDLGDEIPEALYRCVAQIIAFAYRLRGRVPAGWGETEDGGTAGTGAAADDAAASTLPALLSPDATNPGQP